MDEKLNEAINTDDSELEIVELTDDEGKILKFYHIATLEYKKRWFAFFQPAEEIDGVEDEEVVIFEIVGDEGEETLAPVEDEDLLDEVYAKFLKEMEEEDCDCDDCDDCDDDCDDEKCGCGCGCGCDHKEK